MGSGKSIASMVKLFLNAMEQPVQQDNIIRARSAIIRNTGPMLRTTTISSWLDWFPEHVFGPMVWQPVTKHIVRIGNLEWEVLFIPLDKPSDVKRLMSLELTSAFVNEGRYVPKDIVDGVTGRVNRYPAERHGGVVNPMTIIDTNSPEEDHWIPIMSGETDAPDWMNEEERLTLIKPKNWKFFSQPSAMNEIRADGRLIGYDLSDVRENGRHTAGNYYPQLITGKSRRWIKVLVMNELGTEEELRLVYPDFDVDTHVAKETLQPINGHTVYVGMDFGLTPAVTIGQKVGDRWRILREVIGDNMGAKRFAPHLRGTLSLLNLQERGCPVKVFGDPAGDDRGQADEKTPFQILRKAGIKIFPAPTNDIELRVGAVENALTRMVMGQSGLLIDPSCRTLLAGFKGKFNYPKRGTVNGAEIYDDKPTKNAYSHVQDAAQYMMLGAGEGRDQIAAKSSRSGRAKSSFNVFDRMKGRQPMRGRSSVR